jgi:hypothetical protein
VFKPLSDHAMGQFGLASVLILHTALIAVALPLLSKSPLPSESPTEFDISSSRSRIDSLNLTFSTISDAAFVSVGAEKGSAPWGDVLGTLKATAVLIRTPTLPADTYAPTRLSVLLSLPLHESGPRDMLAFLYSDDGSSDHNPGVKV